MSLTITQVQNDLLSKLGLEDPTQATDGALQDVLIAINGAMQQLQTAGQDYFTREKLSIAFAAGTSMYPLPQSIQSVIGPLRLNSGQSIRALSSRGELDQFDRIFLGVSSFGAAQGNPFAYWIENLRDDAGPDANQITLHLVPVPLNGGSVTIEVVNDAPTYTLEDLVTDIVLPIAQNYTESIFLPIARWLVTRSSLFSRPELLDGLEKDYNNAIARLAMAGGFPAAVQPAPDRAPQA
jgi:hypothetical protein